MPKQIGAALRRQVAEQAHSRCEYCLIRDTDAGYSHQVDHIVSRKHGGRSILENLAYACAICNRLKGSDVAALEPSGEPVRLFHPRTGSWPDHFRVEGPYIRPLTAEGEATIRVLRMNSPDRVAERRLLQALGPIPQRDRRYRRTSSLPPCSAQSSGVAW